MQIVTAVWALWFGVPDVESSIPSTLLPYWKYFVPTPFYTDSTTQDNFSAIVTNLFLLFIFGFMHSFFASSYGHRVLSFLPESQLRSFYVF